MIATCWAVTRVVFWHPVQEFDRSRAYRVVFRHLLQVSDVPGLSLVAFIHLVQGQVGRSDPISRLTVGNELDRRFQPGPSRFARADGPDITTIHESSRTGPIPGYEKRPEAIQPVS